MDGWGYLIMSKAEVAELKALLGKKYPSIY
jgi:hypothetical protein